MTAATATRQGASDIATTIANALRELGVPGLPRNYELLYEVFTGTNETLQGEFFALGNRATQEQLDGLGRKYLMQSNGYGIVESARAQIEVKLDEIRELLNRERDSLDKYGLILDRTSDGLNGRDAVTKEFLQKILAITTAATETTRQQSQQIASSIVDKSAELESVKTKLEEYKKLADTDALTQIGNRRAFDAALSGLYASKRATMFGSLLLIDIDRFKEINDRFGHPVGDRIIQLVAGILRDSVGDGGFVARTGGEEFAIVIEGLPEESVAKLAERLRAEIEGTTFANRESGTNYGPVTVSAGICMASEASGPADLYAKVDGAMYASKVNGRNRVTRHSAMSAGAASKNWMLYRSE
ncbi:MAG: GGDEF domain-containing protein [Rhizobiaceae bacterium]|nr:GGDEF domain-containing protein [Rhizobiaceae bacterium]MCV0408267.1 GGDEF domain-containing protein [Rhizobiaceae bacterium]